VTDIDPDSRPEELALIVRRTIRASAERVFDAWTRPEHLVRWWGPRPVRCSGAEVDLRVGGRYRIANQFPDGKVLWIVGEFELVKPPHKLVYTWRLEPGSPSSERVTVRFEPRDGATEVIIVHERIASAAARATHGQGWEGCLDGLAAFLDAA
jgi:uncharacterized protein YndB with AHSA1/START domain